MALDVYLVAPGTREPESDTFSGFGMGDELDTLYPVVSAARETFPLLFRLDPYDNFVCGTVDVPRLLQEIALVLPGLPHDSDITRSLTRLEQLCAQAIYENRDLFFFGD